MKDLLLRLELLNKKYSGGRYSMKDGRLTYTIATLLPDEEATLADLEARLAADHLVADTVGASHYASG